MLVEPLGTMSVCLPRLIQNLREIAVHQRFACHQVAEVQLHEQQQVDNCREVHEYIEHPEAPQVVRGHEGRMLREHEDW